MIFKSYLIEQNLSTLNKYKMFLFYGENEGLKKELKDNIKQINKDKETISFFQDEIIKNNNILVNEVINKSLFDKQKVIFIDQVNDKILDVLEIVSDSIDEERIFIFASVLDKKSKLRSFFEKSKNYGICPCYQDNEITIKKIITKQLNNYLGLSPQVINIISENSGLERDKLNNELEKIKCCFKDKKINLEELNSLLNIKTNEDFNKLKDEALNGNKINTNRLLADTSFEPENNIFYLNSINQRINKLYEIEELKKQNSNIEILISSLKPPVFWKDKPMLVSQTKKWNKKKLQTLLKKTYETEIKIKSNSVIRKDLLMKNLIVDICSAANSV